MATKGKTWRFNVIRQDASRRATPPSTGTIYAGMVVRAPKGLAKPVLFGVGDAQGIKGMIGEGGANWPDIDELLTINNEFPVYVSAPAGSKSTYGGVHVTKYGIFKFYNVTDPTEDNYKVNLTKTQIEKIFKGKYTFTAASAVTTDGVTTNSESSTAIELPTAIGLKVVSALVDGDEVVIDDSHLTKDAEKGTVTITLKGAKAEDSVTLITDLEDDVYYSVYQNSPTEKEGELTISAQGLNKYVTDKSVITVPATFNTKKSLKDLILNKYPTEVNSDIILVQDKGVYEWNYITEEYSDVTDYYNTQTFRIVNAYSTAFVDEVKASSSEDEVLKNAIDKIYIVNNDKLAEVTEDGLVYVDGEKDDEYKLSNFENKDFNTTTIQLVEHLNDGSEFATNAIKFSLDEEGVDQFGNNIYLDSVLSEDDKTTVLAKVRKTFDDDLNTRGFYQGNLNSGDNKVTISGTREITSIMNKNLKARKTGGEYNVDYSPIINQGLTEFYDPEMDICSIIAEPTGCQTLKGTLKTVAQKNDLAVVVTQKIVSDSDMLNLSRISADCRVSNVAEYAGQFFTRDPNSHKGYWVCPIGSVVLMLMRIIADKEGAYAPMWNNDGRYGGELSDRTYIKARNKWTDPDTEILDKKGINPLKMTENGVMMLSQRTTMSLNESLHYCRLMYVMAFNKCIRELRDDVAHMMIGKKVNLKNPYWLNTAQTVTNRILARRLSGEDPAWESAEGDCISFNNEQTLAEERFVFKVVVVPATGIEKVTLIFKNQNGGTTISWE